MDNTNKNLSMVSTDHKSKSLTKSFINVKEEQIKYLTRDEVRSIINEIKGHKEKFIFLFMWFTGSRVTEVINIRKKDIDFQNKEIKIRWLKNRKYLYRTMPIHPQLNDLLTFTTQGLNQEDKVFPYSRQRVWQMVKKHFPKEFSWCHPHTLRHSFAVNYLRQADSANDLVILMKLMGHSSILTTMKYLSIVPKDQAKQLAKIIF
jgi:integrase